MSADLDVYLREAADSLRGVRALLFHAAFDAEQDALHAGHSLPASVDRGEVAGQLKALADQVSTLLVATGRVRRGLRVRDGAQ
jgi:hypothetical protein